MHNFHFTIILSFGNYPINEIKSLKKGGTNWKKIMALLGTNPIPTKQSFLLNYII